MKTFPGLFFNRRLAPVYRCLGDPKDPVLSGQTNRADQASRAGAAPFRLVCQFAGPPQGNGCQRSHRPGGWLSQCGQAGFRLRRAPQRGRDRSGAGQPRTTALLGGRPPTADRSLRTGAGMNGVPNKRAAPPALPGFEGLFLQNRDLLPRTAGIRQG